MPNRVTKAEHPITAVLIHWAHLASSVALTVTGLQIHFLPAAMRADSAADSSHMTWMTVFALSALLRFMWAFLGAGSADRGCDERVDDWRHFVFSRGDLKAAGAWLRHYVAGTEAPASAKYNPLQRLVYAVLFPLSIIFVALTGLALDPAFSESLAWVTRALGGEGSVRITHFSLMWVLVVLTALHLFAALNDGTGRVQLMLFRRVPRNAAKADPE